MKGGGGARRTPPGERAPAGAASLPDAGRDLGALLASLGAWWFVCDAGDRILACHPAEGVGPSGGGLDARGGNLGEALPSPAAASLVAAAARCRAKGEPTVLELAFKSPATKRTYEARVVPLGEGRVGIVGIDSTAQAMTLRALQKSEERFRLAFMTSPDAIAINRVADGQYVATNQGFTELLGWREDEVVGRTSLDLGIWARPEERELLLTQLERAGRARIEGHFRRRNGETGVGVLSAVRFDLDGAPHILSVTRDVSQEREAERERVRLEDALRRSQKLEALGRLAGGIAHDFNNLLTGILGYSELLERSIRKGVPRSRDLEQIRRAAERARDLVHQLLAFARKQPVAPKVVSLNEAIRGWEKLLRRILGEDVELVVELAPDLWPIKIDVSQLEQVILNLAVNGRDAMPECGTLTITTANVGLGEGPVAAGAGAKGGPFVMLAVSDTGVGMSDETLVHLFEPFFTTKAAGTGLGLATVYGIVEQSGGHVSVRSGEGQGSTFQVLLPRTTDPVLEEAVGPPTEAPGGTETVLVVEDDDTVRELVELALRDAGYRVLVARGGREALHAAAATNETIHVLLTDVVMPAMSGREVAARLRVGRPDLKVLFLSGYDRGLVGQEDLQDGSTHLLAKPFTPLQLRRRVREVLDPPAARGTGRVE